jgi:hypothetical protein
VLGRTGRLSNALVEIDSGLVHALPTRRGRPTDFDGYTDEELADL